MFNYYLSSIKRFMCRAPRPAFELLYHPNTNELTSVIPMPALAPKKMGKRVTIPSFKAIAMAGNAVARIDESIIAAEDGEGGF